MSRCLQCLDVEAEARLDGMPVCVDCAERIVFGQRPRDLRQCSRCRGPMGGMGFDDQTPVCRQCVEAEFDRAMALELNRGVADLLPPVRERPVRPLPLPLPTRSQVANDLQRLRERFRRDGVIVPPKRDWLED